MSKSVPMPYTRRVRSGGVTTKVLVFPSDPSYRDSRPPRKKKAVRKPNDLRDSGGYLIASCEVRTSGEIVITVYDTDLSVVEAYRLSRWLLRAAAWVEGGRR